MEHLTGQVQQNQLAIAIEMDRKLKNSSDWLLQQLENFKKPLDGVFTTKENKETDIGKTQFRNLLRASSSAAGIAELTLFIQYQMGRDSYGNGWSKSVGTPVRPFGEWVIDILSAIEAKSGSLTTDGSDEMKKVLSLKMTERFFIYLNWHVSYLETKKKREFNNNKDNRDRFDKRRQDGGRR